VEHQIDSKENAVFSGAAQRPVVDGARPGGNWWRTAFLLGRTENRTVGRVLWQMGEAALLSALALLFGHWMAPADPFSVHAGFQWIWIVPALLAMRYGSGIGVVSVLLMLAGWLGWRHFFPDGADEIFPQMYFLGGLVLTLICGQFAEIWSSRNRRLSAINSYLDERLTTLTKKHFLLTLSHERLEQDLFSKPMTLRESLERMRAATVAQPVGVDQPLPAADAFMQILAQSCQLEIAAVYASDRQGLVATRPAAMLGQCAALDPDDALLLYCMEQQKLAHVQTAGLPQQSSSRYLICAPLKNFDGTILGVLVVEKMPFVALNDDTVRLLSVLVDYYADGIQISEVAHDLVAQMPGCPSEMAADIVRLHRLKKTMNIDSALVALILDTDDLSRDVFEQIMRLKRAADVVWEIPAGSLPGSAIEQRNVLITLLPLSGLAAVEGYLMRIEEVVKTQFGGKFPIGDAKIHITHMGNDTPLHMLTKLVQRCAL
jgi:hypothetical protein